MTFQYANQMKSHPVRKKKRRKKLRKHFTNNLSQCSNLDLILSMELIHNSSSMDHTHSSNSRLSCSSSNQLTLNNIIRTIMLNIRNRCRLIINIMGSIQLSSNKLKLLNNRLKIKHMLSHNRHRLNKLKLSHNMHRLSHNRHRLSHRLSSNMLSTSTQLPPINSQLLL
jgi:hypothetical protein